LGAQISLFARDGVQSARLQLNPAEMGPISVQIALDGSAARVDFQADLAGTREVIEASLPALAGALQDAGLTLAGGGVFQQAPGRQGQDQAPGSVPSQRSAGRDLDGSHAGPPPETLVRARRGLVDLVA
ncbi:MAG: flagellar hook-length control protein FliK, partial [Aquabacterium sp.]|nr:flagellar hook-length control protein FliK [Aquabacterium sp.]